ncbi:MAG: Dam family site-specific DNA-(adenine-N6)-methyltransferase, partial [Firmicutes bacterium]|nr:Dam family site-specific DNA-(adenine-N6)-methyltransferase [Bacillota bacterium]
MDNITYRPFLKWAGGKFRLVSRIRGVLPKGNRLIEPFAGSAALWLNTSYSHALIADVNPDLIQLYHTVQSHSFAFIAAARALFTPENNTAARYYALREEFNACTDPWRRSVLFLYLNRHGYNGLCRYNASGGFNVPFGRYHRPYFPEKELTFFAEKSQKEHVS